MKPVGHLPHGNDLGRDELDGLAHLRNLPSLPPPPLPPGLEAELAQLTPTRPRRPTRGLVRTTAISIAYAGILLTVLSTRRDLEHLPRMWLVLYGLAWLIGFAVPLHVALVPRPGAIMPRWRLGGALAALSAIGFVAAGFLFPRTAANSSLLTGLAYGHECLSIGLATAVVPVILGTLLLRGAAPVGSRLTAAALGAAGGSLGGLVLHLYCPITDALHVGVVHGGVVACAAVLAALVVPRALEPRAPRR